MEKPDAKETYADADADAVVIKKNKKTNVIHLFSLDVL